ncbi:hypothetical protein [Ornithinimicrobium kibberense]|uniref:hypothetical protein n=1 Tax=Ornithinimicrobium kibberense TaxID=282060 RepID=UPI00361B1F07
MGLGIFAAAGVGARAGLRQGVPVLLDFLLAAGLLRLSTDLGWAGAGSVALIVTIRHLVTFGLHVGGSAAEPFRHIPAGRAGRHRQPAPERAQHLDG